jgi:hypothetical protein
VWLLRRLCRSRYRYHNAHAGFFALQAIARTGFDQSLGRNPEVISGRLYKPQAAPVSDVDGPHPTARGPLGIDVDVPRGRVTVAASAARVGLGERGVLPAAARSRSRCATAGAMNVRTTTWIIGRHWNSCSRRRCR